ncbi:prephenate dehydrogenase/arogenate dehydrogenase family protein [Streptomyces cyaneochromogenes]|uniref:Prephenate dehydrogenase/arogenate dehydrogenase family protein n=1 Tax=Streptomyces cyaneochromogenes TaxID=2496836 RepID=A0A3S5HT82_9ACTN|nr:prephenate dehydrogenase [Streptomyces cyaneochromogenes]AZQ32321.1 prephenate dehydrogenase/arogenate dehydrogenase family protein [Streptomyces cyaneochromogenes]
MIRTLAVVGTGLIGTSVALAAARRGVTVHLLDADASAVRTAELLGAGTAKPPEEPVDLAVLAVPPSKVADVLSDQQARGLAHSYTDVASVKAGPEREVLARAARPTHFVGGHPLAGRERSGPLAARPDLFKDRVWVLTPSRLTSKPTFDRALDLIALCGGVPTVMQSGAHDETVALTSHAPHLMASLIAARLGGRSPVTALLVGQGFRDATRIARGEARLWTDIIETNAAEVAGVLTALQTDLTELLTAVGELSLRDPRHRARSRQNLTGLLERGVAALEALPAPASGPLAADTAHVDVTIAERPGELARLLDTAAASGAGPDTVAAPLFPQGPDGPLVIRFELAADEADTLAEKLASAGWDVVQHPDVRDETELALVGLPV